jgi:transcriptional regulator with PAS, ATPase and Fis domain
MELKTIRHEVQDIAEAISLAVGCDVEAIDEKQTRIAATGDIRPTLGQRLKHGHVYRHVMQKQQTTIVDCPGTLDLCKVCKIKDSCYYDYSVVSPIVVNGHSVGVFAVISFNPANAEKLRLQSVNLAHFVERMASLVSTKLKEQQLMSSLDLARAELTAILNKVDYGLVAFNNCGEVLHYNKSAERLLNLSVAKNPVEKIQKALTPFLSNKDEGKVSKTVLCDNKPLLIDLETVTVFNRQLPNQALTLVNFLDYATVKRKASSVTIGDRPITFDDILTKNPIMQKLIDFSKKVAKSNSTIFLRGASGTGKEMFARAIHHGSGRTGNFIPINCGAIPETLLESELFGYECGAFTGAKKEGKPGKFELADGGTIFLDEVGTMPLHLQSKLLRVLEEQRVDRLGGKQSFPIDVRIIAATNENLEERIKDGLFREDLFFRLNVIPLYIPPLRERPEDILLLGTHYLQRYCKMLGKKVDGFSDEIQSWMLDYPWPGNIRELSNVIEFAVNIEDSSILTMSSLPPHFGQSSQPSCLCNRDIQRKEKLKSILQEQGWGKSGKQYAADSFGVSLATIYRWVSSFHLQRSAKSCSPR